VARVLTLRVAAAVISFIPIIVASNRQHHQLGLSTRRRIAQGAQDTREAKAVPDPAHAHP
jgi:hypothetical protein